MSQHGYGGWGGPPPGGPGGPQGQAPVGMPPGAPGYGTAPLARAQAAIRGSRQHVKSQKYAVVGVGAIMTLTGIVLMFTVDPAGIWLAISGVVTMVATFAMAPLFTKPLDDVMARVDAAAGVMAHRAHVLQHGVPAFGRIVQIQQTGRMFNSSLEVAAVVEVHHPQHGTYQAQATGLVPPLGIPLVQPGYQVQLRVSPQNPQDVALMV
jgi:hypothetical protein